MKTLEMMQFANSILSFLVVEFYLLSSFCIFVTMSIAFLAKILNINNCLFVFVMACYFCASAQTLDTAKISKDKGIGRIVKYEKLSHNCGAFMPNFYALYLIDKTVRIYNSDIDTLDKKSFTYFTNYDLFYIGLSNHWEIYNEDFDVKLFRKTKAIWKLVDTFPSSKFDSIRILENLYELIAFKNKQHFLFNYSEVNRHRSNIIELKASRDFIPYAFKGGLIYKTLPIEGESKRGGYTYLKYNYDSSLKINSYLFDTILILPHYNTYFGLVKKDEQLMIFSYLDNKVVDSVFTNYYVVPNIQKIFTVHNDSICLYGDNKQTFPIVGTTKIEFKPFGDMVYAMVETKDGTKYTIDCWYGVIQKQSQFLDEIHH